MSDMEKLLRSLVKECGARDSSAVMLRDIPDVRQIVRQVEINEDAVDDFVRRKLEDLEWRIRHEPRILEILFDVDKLKHKLRLLARAKLALNQALEPW